MPLLDHFRPPLRGPRRWEGFHSAWATEIARQLNEDLLPTGYFAEPNVRLGTQVEIDGATLEEKDGKPGVPGGAATAMWAPPRPTLSVPVSFAHLDTFEVLVFQELGGAQLRAAVELVSPANKDRPGHRQALAVKCAGYLSHAVAVVLIDVVTERAANLHADILGVLDVATEPPPLAVADGSLRRRLPGDELGGIAAVGGLDGGPSAGRRSADAAVVARGGPVRSAGARACLHRHLCRAADPRLTTGPPSRVARRGREPL